MYLRTMYKVLSCITIIYHMVNSVLLDSEDDMHQCGRCKMTFNRLEEYISHKRSRQCRKTSDHRKENQPVLLGVLPASRADDNDDCSPVGSFSVSSNSCEVLGLCCGSSTITKIFSPNCNVSASDTAETERVGHQVSDAAESGQLHAVDNCHDGLHAVSELLNETISAIAPAEAPVSMGEQPLEVFDDAPSVGTSDNHEMRVEMIDIAEGTRPPPAYKCPQM